VSGLCRVSYAGFPLTDTQLGASFAVVTGHVPASIDWEGLRGAATLVILMGAKGLPAIVEGLTKAGRSPDTPVSACWCWVNCLLMLLDLYT
jgi:siroheme synthase